MHIRIYMDYIGELQHMQSVVRGLCADWLQTVTITRSRMVMALWVPSELPINVSKFKPMNANIDLGPVPFRSGSATCVAMTIYPTSSLRKTFGV
jgi:hypothetical protein